jgi:hypothetical protein
MKFGVFIFIVALPFFALSQNLKPMYNLNNNHDNGYSITSEAIGVSADFILHKDYHCRFLASYFGKNTNTLDQSLTSLAYLDSLVKTVPSEKVRDLLLFQSMIAYCGQVVSNAVNGNWYIEELPSYQDKEKMRYFPFIMDVNNNRYDFFGIVLNYIEHYTKRSLYEDVKGLISSPKLSVQKCDIGIFKLGFPPLDYKD